MPQVIVVDHPGYSRVYRRPAQDHAVDDRLTLDLGEAWAEWVDEHADSVATPDYLAERSTDSRRPLAHLGNRVTHCVIPLPTSWAGRVPNYYRPPPPSTGGTPATMAEVERQEGDRSAAIRADIAEMSAVTYERAARWSRPHGIVSILVGHGASVLGVGGTMSQAGVDLAPASAAFTSTNFLRALELQVRARREQGQTLAQMAAQSEWSSMSRLMLRSAVAFRAAGVRRVDLLQCQAGIGVQGLTFMNTLARFWGAQVRAMRGTAAYDADGRWYVIRPTFGPPTFSVRPDVPSYRSVEHSTDLLGTNHPAYRGWPPYLESEMPGYPPDAMFHSSNNPGRPL